VPHTAHNLLDQLHNTQPSVELLLSCMPLQTTLRQRDVRLRRRLRVVSRLVPIRVPLCRTRHLTLVRWRGCRFNVGMTVRGAHPLAEIDLAQLLANGALMAETMSRKICMAGTPLVCACHICYPETRA
jgi:hypothetical protein